MKHLLIFIIFLISSAFCFSQNIVDSDSLLKKLNEQLPKGWVMQQTNKNLIILRKDSIWILYTNHINEPVSLEKKSDKEIEDKFKKFGKKKIGKITFKLEPRWNQAKIIKVKKKNEEILNKISILPKKYNIEALRDKHLSSKGKDFYIGHTKDEKDRIEKFETEEQKLKSNLIEIPNLNSEKYSMFLLSKTGCNDEYTDVLPEKASIELYKILQLIEDICGVKE